MSLQQFHAHMFAIAPRKLLLKDPRNYAKSMKIVKVDHLLSFVSNKNACVDGAMAKLDKTVEEAGFLGVSKTPSKL